jgi:RNA polymerase sigma-70 factor (sigma-E family)
MEQDTLEFREFIAARLDSLRRTAFVLSRDWHTADDLVSETVIKLLRMWRRIDKDANPDAYVHRILINVWLDERRRPWRRESPSVALPDTPRTDHARDAVDRITVLEQLARLPKRRRAVVVLRFYCDMSVEQTAEVLGCSTGTVKSQTARALDTLRTALVDISQSNSI